ncbi:MAG: RidA family protein [Spirochaetia bacterium]|jgi:enamine deaminase RidA (YjgF/YER057c/UK114 family)|uniref:Endoribonuclease L-PSP/chorismate mutase-like domain-containing protein n=1 Tax=bioreactor metagenome TaxID=1076179 RepID=A0A644TUB8_9ZZZZ|nr:RidA family protein [Spirochaetia bacterium]NLX45839.1 RidA family protein [Treponema sp.]VBB38917.1 Endoribonuclease L-PSP [uncultured Spirochaetota bacterium]HAP55947.1 RidA family protein [Spirochaetaceae bacterium]HOI23502.1 RidA family protein [Spirochaetales bacterium]
MKESRAEKNNAICIYEKLKQLAVELPPHTSPNGSYTMTSEFGGRCFYTAGTGCALNGKPFAVGRLGKEVSVKQGKLAARQCVLNVLANLHACLGDLNRINRVIKTTVFVASAEGFGDQSSVAEGASELLLALFGPAGHGVRTAIGTSALPKNQAVEIEMLFELKEPL